MANDPYFTNTRDTGVKTQYVKNAPVRITRAADGSRGKEVKSELIDISDVDDWLPDERDIPDGGKPSGFAAHAEMHGDLNSYEDEYPIDRLSRTNAVPLDAKSLMSRDDAARKRVARVHIDPVTHVPDNFAAIDRMPESDRFYGKDKEEAETTDAMERAEKVDRTMERVDYKSSKSVPIKMIRR